MNGELVLVVTAEHGGNDVPPGFAERFRGFESLLTSHRGWDPGSLDLARVLASRLDATLITATVTRLLVDLNRSPHHRDVFSEVTRGLEPSARRELLETWHRPHRQRVIDAVAGAVSQGTVFCISGFTPSPPELNGVVRKPDIAFLYDPQRPWEAQIARAWAKAVVSRLPERVIRRNDPYRGAADGLTRTLRQLYPDGSYAGIEIEVNQRHVGAEGCFPDWVGDALVDTLESTLR